MNALELLEGPASQLWAGTKDSARSMDRAIRCAQLLGDTPVEKIDTLCLDRMVEALKKAGLGPSSCNRAASAISKLLRWAVARDLAKQVPSLPWQPEPRGRDRTLSSEELVRISGWFAANTGAHYGAFVLFLVETGLRAGEAHSVQWANTSRDADGLWWITVLDTKNGTDRSIPLSKAAYRAMKTAGGKVAPFEAVDRGWLSTLWVRMRKATGLSSDCVPHSLRHTRASLLVNADVPLAHIQAWLGHRSVKTTMRYCHTDKTSLARALKTMESVK